MHRLKFRLLDYQNQNQMLRKELLVAKKVIGKELTGSDDVNIKSFLKLDTFGDFKGRQENILILKDQITEIQNKIQELGDVLSDDETEKEPKRKEKDKSGKDRNITKDILEQQIPCKELKYLIESCCQMKRKIEIWKNRNKELSKEVEVLRLEKERALEKSREGEEAQESYLVTEKELRDRQHERFDLRRKLDLAYSRNQVLAEENQSLQDDIRKMEGKIRDDTTLIEALTDQQGHLQDFLDRQRMIFDNDGRRHREDLREMLVKHSTHTSLLNQIEEMVDEKYEQYRKLRNSVPLIVYATDGEKDEKSTKDDTPSTADQSM
ncbi:golgin subfamily A member 6-like protein 4 [Uloborus diversus]|uniref:golgin subfamily A member 6-like protein 4 n=1 Tax=Uloborus diversus TaxID=327109 RepID=UPI00240A0DC0|nr:golgin subfamily A member 6-like protein 4 [Uloborus diversus]